jgi:hypothetical protein
LLVAAAVVAAVATVDSAVDEVTGNYDESDGNRNRASDAAGVGEQEWSGDRTHTNNELAPVTVGQSANAAVEGTRRASGLPLPL